MQPGRFWFMLFHKRVCGPVADNLFHLDDDGEGRDWWVGLRDHNGLMWDFLDGDGLTPTVSMVSWRYYV